MSWLANPSIWVSFSWLISLPSRDPVSAPPSVSWFLNGYQINIFYHIVVWISSYSYKYLKLSSGAQLSYLEAIWYTWVCLDLRFMRENGTEFRVTPHYLGGPFTQGPVNTGFPSWAGGCRHLFLALVFPPILSATSSPAPGGLLAYVGCSVLCWIVERDPCKWWCLPFSAVTTFVLFLPSKLQLPLPPWALRTISWTQGTLWVLPAFSFLHRFGETPLWQ